MEPESSLPHSQASSTWPYQISHYYHYYYYYYYYYCLRIFRNFHFHSIHVIWSSDIWIPTYSDKDSNDWIQLQLTYADRSSRYDCISFGRLHIVAKRACCLRHACPFVCRQQLGLHWADFPEIECWKLSLPSVGRLYIYWPSNKNTGKFVWGPQYMACCSRLHKTAIKAQPPSDVASGCSNSQKGINITRTRHSVVLYVKL